MLEPGGEEVEDPARGDHGDRAEGERDRRRDRRAEDEQQDDQQERQGDQLAALGWRRSIRPGSPARGSRSRSGSRGPGRGSVLRGCGSSCGTVSLTAVLDVDVEVGEDQRPARARAQPLRPRRGPRARAWSPAGRGAGRGSAPGPGGRSPPPGPRSRIANGRRVAEVFAQQLVGRARIGAGDVERGRVEPALDAGADHAEGDEDQRRDGQHRARVAQQQRLASARSSPADPAVPCSSSFPPW